MNPFEKMELKKETFTKKEMIIYDLLHNDLEIILRSSATDLSKNYHVSQATITRFCQKLGYDGFNEFKFDVFRLEKKNTDSSLDNETYIDSYIHLFNIIQSSLDYQQLENLANDIIQSENVIISGFHKSSLPAKMLQYNLFKFNKKAIVLNNDEIHELPHIITSQDIFIFFTNRGNGLNTLKPLLKESKENIQYQLALITMNDKLSIKKYCDQYIWLPSSTNQNFQQYLENQIVFFLYIDLLTSQIAKKI